jgi:hypothetical protein
MKRRPEFSIALAVLLAVAPLARADLVEIRWDAQGRFEHAALVAPGKFAEVCGKLARADAVAWSFESDQPLAFNIHYHQGKQVVTPEKRDAVSRADGRLEAALEQDYCWMWSNKSAVPAKLDLRLGKVEG